jgi:hypothetical protein
MGLIRLMQKKRGIDIPFFQNCIILIWILWDKSSIIHKIIKTIICYSASAVTLYFVNIYVTKRQIANAIFILKTQLSKINFTFYNWH